jgi:tetrahydromethanopterin S-methyltransferase subunit F
MKFKPIFSIGRHSLCLAMSQSKKEKLESQAMAYRQSTDSADAIYRERVRRRLIRSHPGLSWTGCIGVAIIVALAVVLIAIPSHRSANRGSSRPAISQGDD